MEQGFLPGLPILRHACHGLGSGPWCILHLACFPTLVILSSLLIVFCFVCGFMEAYCLILMHSSDVVHILGGVYCICTGLVVKQWNGMHFLESLL